ncbi:hypothetical protein MYX82_08960, partial [Acidobacteria bacterium AH-259-D05]|nr:hypothetical protein [Acidobacteria bacterium AH-259-D05]
LERHYLKEGYEVYSKHSAHLPAIPTGWNGPLPDMVAEKETERVAIFLETSNSLINSSTPDRWRHAAEDNEATLRLFVHRESDLELLRKVLQKEQLSADIALLERQTFKRASRRSWFRITIVLILISAIGYLALWLASYLYNYRTDLYEPKDMEREDRLPER